MIADESQTEAIRAELEAKLDTLKRRFGRIDDHLHNRNRDVPADWSERASFQSNEEVVEALEPKTLQEIEAVQNALARLDAGEWLDCATCHKPIEAKRLLLLPETQHCSRCARKNA